MDGHLSKKIASHLFSNMNLHKMIFLQTKESIQDFLFNNNYLILYVIIKNQMINIKIFRISY